MENGFQDQSWKRKGLFSFYGALCLSVAFMVFAWGTNYKLSLYHAPHNSSPAKVCTRGSDAAKSAFDHAANGRVVAQAPLSVAVLFSLLQRPQARAMDWLRDEAGGDPSPLSRAPILYLRPPPDELR
jgi:hypothetical protein